MPNWCENELTIKGDPGEIERLLEAGYEFDPTADLGVGSHLWISPKRLFPPPAEVVSRSEEVGIISMAELGWRKKNWGMRGDFVFWSQEPPEIVGERLRWGLTPPGIQLMNS